MNKNALVTGVLLLLVFVIGFGLGRMSVGTGNIVENISGIEDSNTAPTTDSNTAETQDSSGTTINTDNLTDSQRQMLKALGIDADNITITPQMVACAEAKLGAARIEEIKNGASPSFSEGAALVACYR